MKRNWTQELSVVTLLDILKDLGVISFMIPLIRPFFETGNAQFFEDVEFVGGEKIKDFVFEEEHVEIPLIAFDNDQVQASIPYIVQEAIPDQDNVVDPPAQVQQIVPEEQTLQPQEPMSLRRSTRERRSAISDDYVVFLQEHEVGIGVVEDDPINFRQAIESSNSQKWIDAMNEEMKSMKDNDVWDFVPLLEGAKPIGCKWIFKTKKNSKGNVERYKARLVAKGKGLYTERRHRL